MEAYGSFPHAPLQALLAGKGYRIPGREANAGDPWWGGSRTRTAYAVCLLTLFIRSVSYPTPYSSNSTHNFASLGGCCPAALWVDRVTRVPDQDVGVASLVTQGKGVVAAGRHQISHRPES
jgi:hypothetical protein